MNYNKATKKEISADHIRLQMENRKLRMTARRLETIEKKAERLKGERDAVQRKVNQLMIGKEDCVRFHIYLIEAVKQGRKNQAYAITAAALSVAGLGLWLIGWSFWPSFVAIAAALSFYAAFTDNPAHQVATEEDPLFYEEKDRRKVNLAKDF